MHGIVHDEFRRYAISQLGRARWLEILGLAGLPDLAYSVSRTYPDDDLFAQVLALARTSGVQLDAVLADFGRAVAPGLLQTYGAFVERHWKTANVLENVERVIHRTVRLQDPSASPPYLTAWRRNDDVMIHYTSPRRLCAFGKGLIEGIAATYAEQAEIHDDACMHHGDDACLLRVSLRPLDTIDRSR